MRKPINLSALTGMELPTVEVDVPPGLNTGQTIQVRSALLECVHVWTNDSCVGQGL